MPKSPAVSRGCLPRPALGLPLRPAAVVLLLPLFVAVCAAKAEYLGPADVAVCDDGGTLYVLEQDASRLDAVDTRSGEITDSLSLPASPRRLCWFPGKSLLAVSAGEGAGRVLLVGLDPLSVLREIPLGHSPCGMAAAPNGKRLYVADRFGGVVRVVDTGVDQEVAAWPVGREPLSVAITPDGATLVVANHQPSGPSDSLDQAGIVTLVDTATGRSEPVALPLRGMNVRDVALTPDGRWALVTHVLPHLDLLAFQNSDGWTNSNALSIIDVQDRRRVNTLVLDQFGKGAGNPWGVSCSPDGKTIVVCLAGTHEVALLDSAVIRREVEEPGPESPLEYGTDNYTSNLEPFLRRVRLPLAGIRRAVVSGDRLFAPAYFDDALAEIPLEAGSSVPPRIIRLGNPPVLSKERRGEKLFHDALISRQHWQSCVSCHPDARADGLNWDLLNDGVGNPKNTKSMLFSHETPPAMATGVRATAEIAVRKGLHHILFADTGEEEAECVDAYLKSLRPVPSPRLVNGVLSESAARGRGIFHDPRVGCAACHPAPLYTDRKLHDVGTRSDKDYRSLFDTPTLIETWRTAPYLHDGRYETIESLLREGKHGGADRIDRLTSEELADLVEFVLSL